MEAVIGAGAIKTKSGETEPAEAFKNVKLGMVYFSMLNCPPCRAFTPLLADLYNDTNSSEKVFEVIFCSGDKN